MRSKLTVMTGIQRWVKKKYTKILPIISDREATHYYGTEENGL